MYPEAARQGLSGDKQLFGAVLWLASSQALLRSPNTGAVVERPLPSSSACRRTLRVKKPRTGHWRSGCLHRLGPDIDDSGYTNRCLYPGVLYSPNCLGKRGFLDCCLSQSALQNFFEATWPEEAFLASSRVRAPAFSWASRLSISMPFLQRPALVTLGSTKPLPSSLPVSSS